jgi:hypothetical protein
MTALTSSSTPPTAIPTKRNGNRSSHTTGYKIRASSASGQHSTRRMHHKRNFTMSLLPHHAGDYVASGSLHHTKARVVWFPLPGTPSAGF